ncbi:hypothetical protein ASPZODRAFT_65627 [Penicilliopsis zonata CBS 506.65]|uniref:Midasin n=1 Tax=Penicilliopsis zonata CBS 506.65 TaxID=1073090 RepID=A0A1L9SJ49_9EURO|nr:hypothetical protein ASPZODRAFT_65627 [Penicilliopsis zonata CBS 506.65]OJJ47113.1 hypothetical protein ASPZODRAFT_65627 [Penicilliopsis zonata CBS 506.65]
MNGIPAYEGALDESQVMGQLPGEIVGLIRSASGTQYLNALALGALQPGCTETFFNLYQPIFVDLAARWLISDAHTNQAGVLAAFSRVLPFAPHLRSFARQYALSRAGPLSALVGSKELEILQLDDDTLHVLLLALFRLFSYDLETFSASVSPLQLQALFRHHDRSIRYLAVRCFAFYMHAADAATEKMVLKNVGDEPIFAEWEGITIDYRFLGLWEERRWDALEAKFRRNRLSWSEPEVLSQAENLKEYFTSRTAEICGVLIPRLKDTVRFTSSIVKTPTTVGNLRKIATSLLSSEPILLVGLPNSGKTSLVNDIASAMGQAESLVTLHLNEQTDAKSLLGMYATSPGTGSFAWQPGVLTKAAREGRWVLIEDLDRAPSEVMGLILPIIEKGELTIASRKERIKCADGFKIIATMKSSYNIAGEEIGPSTTMLGSRLWRRVQVNPLSTTEVRDVITQRYPLLESRVPLIMDVYQRVCASFHGSLAIKSSQGRTPGFRDLIKLCSRLHRRIERLGAKTGYEATPEGTEDEIFLDVVDIFLKYLPERSLQNSLAAVVAEALQLSPQRAQFCLHERTPTFSDQGNTIAIGRETCQKIRVPSGSAQKRAGASSRFASTRAALKIMEQVGAAVQMAEPVLLVGETGIGKTTVIQQLATLMRQKLTVVNLSQQSESTDLLGGFKPVNIRTMAVPMLDEFNQLFELTFSAKKNQKFLSSVAKSATAGNWVRLVTLWHEAVRLANGVFKPSPPASAGSEEQPSKKRKLDSPKYQHLRQRWEAFAAQLGEFEVQVSQGDAKFAFAFVQGKIVRALRNGEWVLLDEINLASPDTLENIASLLHHGTEGSPSVLLSEAGDVERVFGHPDFRIFGAMNPATDAGKRDLPPGLRSRFTELYVPSPDTDLDDLLALIKTYLGDLAISDLRAAPDLGQLYMEVKKLSNENKLTDGAGQRPHFSIRTLVRTLIYVIDHAHIYGLRRAIYEGFSMSFLTVLGQESEQLLLPLLERQIFGNAKNARSLLGQTPKPPTDGNTYVQFKHYWMRQGPLSPEEQPHYIVTPFIEKNLKNLVRASSTRRFPVLLQGPTSAGKTSMIEYLAKVSGNKFVRINNHEHTDLQEYLGSYVSADDGTLRYQEGIMVEALRNGYWIVLDELNLAPSDVLEALNRLLDDNRELFIPETQEVVHPHPNFMLFATQNPAGLYGGRKVLSRAFRNRFLELHFDDIPESELEFILKERSQIAPSFCSRIVAVYRKLSLLRQSNRLFEQKNSFATLRDLFRWALRPADDREQLAINGFMLLAERVRNPQERAAVKGVIEEVMRLRIDEEAIYSLSQLEKVSSSLKQLPPNIVWTKAMRRLFVLVSRALENNEPVLLVGETGCGKTQLCQAVAEVFGRELFIVNAHVNLETGDLIGAQRPIRNRAGLEKKLLDDLTKVLGDGMHDQGSLEELTQAFQSLSKETLESFDAALVQKIQKNIARSNALFEWSDGSLITAMKTGQFFLLDEVSLADDSVLERLNSVLEPHRSILLAEKGPIDSMVVADEGFQFLSTMNPGGDYGKRELSAALRNRMTEIWAPQLSEDEDILPILSMKLELSLENLPKTMLQFAKWFKETFQPSSISSLSIRDLLGWVDFINKCHGSDPIFAVVHGAAMVFIDTLGANPAAMLAVALHDLEGNRALCLKKLGELFQVDAAGIYMQTSTVSIDNGALRVGPFSLPMNGDAMPDPQFIMDAPTTIANSVRIARGLQSSKPILLEGSPGVGKTTLVTALARALGKPLTRINLSEQTDLSDLFGSDVPVEGGDVGQFAWRDAPYLQAMQRGDWVLLDEMNLASQSVLEGLNSCLDHRQQVYIAELDQTFKRHPDFVLFAAQNPHHQGGGRKGLPASFVNRFTVVYADSFTDVDLKKICTRLFPGSPSEQTAGLVDFISTLNKAIVQERRLGAIGGPWEVNLRDIQRWLQLADRGSLQIPTKNFLDIVISQRFRSAEDRSLVTQLYQRIFRDTTSDARNLYHNLTPQYFQVGLGVLNRDPVLQRSSDAHMRVVPKDLSVLESLILCIEQSWPSILVGPSGCGKTTLIRKLAAVGGAHLIELALSAETDTMDLIGGFEQMDIKREIESLVQDLALFLQRHAIMAHSSGEEASAVAVFLEVYEVIKSQDVSLRTIFSALSTLSQSYASPDMDILLTRARQLLESSERTETMRVGFEWTEGVLTQAVQNGYWVVLDNANLCNPSVLDRLNSLTEPNGTLILNEQRTEDGSARVIKPHPDFRLFLTMDPRHGELSRAMRNRCIEICFLPQEADHHNYQPGPSYSSESFLYRLRSIWEFNSDAANENLKDSFSVHLDHLSTTDLICLQNSLSFSKSSALHVLHQESLLPVLDRYISVAQENTQRQPFDCIQNEVVLGGATLSVGGPLQPIHPLVNEPLGSIVGTGDVQTQLVILAYLQEIKIDLYYLKQDLERADQSAKLLKPSQMTRIERSLASKRIPALMKDSTQPVGQFIADCGQALYNFIQSLDQGAPRVPEMVSSLRAIMSFCWDIYKATEVQSVNEGEFQIYLQIGRELCASLTESLPILAPLAAVLYQALKLFHAGWTLTTGLSMQRMWESWRPATPSTQEQLKALMDLESIVSEFAASALNSRLKLPQLGQLRNSLIDAQRAILLDGADGNVLVPMLKQAVTELKDAVRSFDLTQTPYFSSSFELLCQFQDIPALWRVSGTSDDSIETTLPLLASRRAQPIDTSKLQAEIPDLLHRLSLFAGYGSPFKIAPAISGTFSLSLLDKLTSINAATLGQMEMLEVEKEILARALSSSTDQASVNQTAALRRLLAKLAKELLVCHGDLLDAPALKNMIAVLETIEQQGSHEGQPAFDLRMEASLPADHYFSTSTSTTLARFINFLTADAHDLEGQVQSVGMAAVQLASIFLRLFVPDKPFDPSLALVVQRKRHGARVSELEMKSQTISSFELEFTGNPTNLRHKLVQDELRELGVAPPPTTVTRPAESDIGLLQAEFSNLINSVLERRPETMVLSVKDNDQHRGELNLMRDNIHQLSQRLSKNYRSYDDITTPVVRFLQMLDFGIFLASSRVPESTELQIVRAVSETTPFLGSKMRPTSDRLIHKLSFNSRYFVDVRFQELSALEVAQSVDSTYLRTRDGRDSLRKILEDFHQLWKTQLTEDQEDEAKKSEMYRYRGSWEDSEDVNEQELQQLFPTYEEEVAEDDCEKARIDPRAISIRLAALQSKLFAPENSEATLSKFVKQSALLLGSIWSKGAASVSPVQPKEHLPGVLMILENALAEGDSESRQNYNFYTDANPAEAKKLVSLTHSVMARFIQLQKAWPEHAVIQDVIACCKEILQFRHAEPVAKFITKIEKLHALVHEWQLVASKEYSAASLYDEITSLTISWRRLELSTWARLLDIENEKCNEDVSSWWFIAYEAIFAAPIQMAASGQEDMSDHIQETISTLEQFFMSTTIGQFKRRMQLVSDFRSLLHVYVADFPALNQLASALGNFLQHLKPFEPAVGKLLSDKRSALEKDIKEQIQLASWRDTNIVALKESARRSHHKLFKVVRKYREILAQSAQSLLQQGMPEPSDEESNVLAHQEFPLPTALIPEALAFCQDNSGLWEQRAPRFKNSDSTAKNMGALYESLSNEFDISEELNEFMTFVIDSIKEFKSQTPKTLTEENKDDVQHLKTQKRRFYAEVLRQLLEMGVKRNVGVSLIEKQSSVAQVLATLPASDLAASTFQLTKSADCYFHRFLDLVPRARQASRNYSEELSNVEVFRSISSVEYLLFIARKQRELIFPSLLELESLKSTLAQISSLWASKPMPITETSATNLGDKEAMSYTVAWLIPILGLAASIIEVHTKFGGKDASPISRGLRTWKDNLSHHNQLLQTLPKIPSGVTSQLHLDVLSNANSCLGELRTDLLSWNQSRPELAFALDQIIPWIDNTLLASYDKSVEKSVPLEAFDKSLLSAVDKMLVGMQNINKVSSAMESTGLLSRSDDFFTRTIKASRLSEINRSIQSVLVQLQNLETNSSLSIASALLASVLPITNTYYAICKGLIERFMSVHRESCKMSYILAKSFTQVASEGFCSPAEASTEENNSGKMESGTGLGEGEGAEDISKDIGDDEDLSELAQEKNENPNDEMDDSADAVNMDQEDLQADTTDQKEGEEKEDESGEEEGEEDIDDEVGSVNDLDPGAVDEKMWDGANDDKQKETENEEGKGVSEADDQTAAQEQKKDQEKKEGDGDEENDEEESEEEAPEDEGEAVGREEMDVTDPHTKEEETLDLPEEMQLDGDEKEGEDAGSDDGMDGMSDMEPDLGDEQVEEHEDKLDQPMEEHEGGEEGEEGENEEEPTEGRADDEEAEVPGEDEPQEPEEDPFLTQQAEDEAAGEEAAPSEAVTGGLAAEQDQSNEKGTSGDAQQESGSTDPSSNTEQQTGAAKDSEESKRSRDTGGADDSSPDDPQLQAFKKMGDILEQWHRRQKEILNASHQEEDSQPLPQDTDMTDADFEHLADQDDAADTQALGQASEEQAQGLDQNKGVESDIKPGENEILPDISDENQDAEANQMEEEMQLDRDTVPTDFRGAGAFIPGSSQAQDPSRDFNGHQDVDEELDEVDQHLAAIHLSSTLPPLTPEIEARRLWSFYESATNDLSLSLTEQLRLILAPTLATKLRGDFRTGKRLNIKRIIPYIASQYKRDKIWMRRSIPSKRNYQIMLAVDDSKSMLESGSGQLAFETLALVAKSLSMLEAGDLCVLGFGSEEHVRVAHGFGKPFSSDAGSQVFQHFSYQQTGTNVRKLIADSIALFREARFKRSPGGGNADLWQLELIISDGICEDHETIRRLVRQAQEERIMIVFIIVDAVKGSSILDLTQASFEADPASGSGEMKLKMKRYLEGFPFPYYLVVRDVRELPAVLATALKQWFAEVVDVSS